MNDNFAIKSTSATVLAPSWFFVSDTGHNRWSLTPAAFSLARASRMFSELVQSRAKLGATTDNISIVPLELVPACDKWEPVEDQTNYAWSLDLFQRDEVPFPPPSAGFAKTLMRRVPAPLAVWREVSA